MEQQPPPTGPASHVSLRANTEAHGMHKSRQDRGRTAHTLAHPPPQPCVMARAATHTMCMHACRCLGMRAVCKRRVPVAGQMYSPLPRSGSWSSRWAGRRCCGKGRWAWRRWCCWVARLRPRSSGLSAQRWRLGSVFLQSPAQDIDFQKRIPWTARGLKNDMSSNSAPLTY